MFVFGSKDKILAHLKQTYPLTRQNESPRSSLSSLASPLLAGFTRSNSHHGKAAEKPPTQQSLGNYELCGSIGSGRWAHVYLGKHKFMQVSVAVKKVMKRDDGVVQRFMLREKEAIKRVRGHPNVVDLYEVFEDSEYIYLVQDYIEGLTLKQLLKEERCLTEAATATCISQLVEALEHCHSRGVVHRDISVSNIMVDTQGTLKLPIADSLNTATFTETCGSAFFTPPEVYAAKYGAQYSGPPVDAWAVGACIHVCVTGALPFNGSQTQCKAGVAYRPPKNCSPELQDLLVRIMEPDARRRLTLRQIRAHPWFALHLKEPTVDRAPAAKAEEEERERCLALMERMGIPREEVLHSLSTNVFNHTSATFYLMRKASWQQRTDAMLKTAGLERSDSKDSGGHEGTLRTLLLQPLVSST